MARVGSISAKMTGVVPSRPRSRSNGTHPGSVRALTVKPSHSPASIDTTPAAPPRRQPVSRPTVTLRVLGALYAWTLWALMVTLVGSQFLGIAWNSSELSADMASPFPLTSDLRRIFEADESPYCDRAIACTLSKRRFSPTQVHLAVSRTGIPASTIDATSSGANGLRLTPRAGNPLEITAEARANYAALCGLMAAIVDPVLDSCAWLGFNVTRDALRVLPSIDDDELVYLRDSLPLVILPFADNSPSARVAVPGWDGSACIFTLAGASIDSSTASAVASGAAVFLVGASRSTTEAFVERQVHSLTDTTGGEWRNGWLEVERSDGARSKWFGTAVSTGRTPDSEIDVPQRQFKLTASESTELDCSVQGECQPITFSEAWKTPATTMDVAMTEFSSAVVANASRFGRYHTHFRSSTRVSSQYDLATFISDVTVLAGLLRWGAALAALHLPHVGRRSAPLFSAGIGVLSRSRSFNLVPILLLPRLRVMLAAFATLGLGGHAAVHAGDQAALLHAWFVVYAATAELLVYIYCLLNWAGVLLRRRVTDALFGPTLAALCLLHYYRDPLAGLWFDEDSTLSAPIEAAAFANAGVPALFTSDLLVRLSGGGSAKNGRALFALKLALLGLNALPLLISTRFTSFQARSRDTGGVCITEKKLAFRASRVGGLGISNMYEDAGDAVGPGRPVLLNGYEVARLGYVVVGGTFLVSIVDWYKLLLLSPTRFVRRLTNIRVVLFAVLAGDQDGKGEGKPGVVREGPVIVRVNDSRLCSVRLTDISLPSFQ